MDSRSGSRSLDLAVTAAVLLTVLVAVAILVGRRSPGILETAAATLSQPSRPATGAEAPEDGAPVGPQGEGSQPPVTEKASPASAGGSVDQWQHAVVRRAIKGTVPVWFGVDFPASWSVDYLDRGITLQSVPFSPVPPRSGYAKVEILVSRRQDVSVPENAVETAGTLGGQPAIRYDFQTDQYQASLIQAEHQGAYYMAWASMVGVSDQALAERYRQTMDRILASVALVPAVVDPSSWTVEHIKRPLGPATGFSIWHPPGWTVQMDQAAGTLTVASPESDDTYDTGQLLIAIRPRPEAEAWDEAGAVGYRLLGQETRLVGETATDGQVRTDYLVAAGSGRWPVTVSMPALSGQAHWLYDQTAWFILTRSAIYYQSAAMESYPGP